jgi:hypothetical protein
VIESIHKFEATRQSFDPIEISKRAQRFNKARFVDEFREFVLK